MSEWRVDHYKSQVAYDEASTSKIELPNSGILAGIMLHIGEQTASTYTASNAKMILEHITKIEVVGNGHEVITSATGLELMSRYAQRHGTMPPMRLYDGLSKYQYQAMPIYFGNAWKDKGFALDLSKWKTVDLKVTNDVTSTDFTDGELKYSVDLFFYDGGAPVKGYMKFTELEYWTTVASETKIINIPKGRFISEILLRCTPAYSATGHDAAGAIYNYLRNIKLTTQNNKKILYDELVRVKQYADRLDTKTNFVTGGVFYGTTGYGAETFIGYCTGFVMNPIGAAHTIIPYVESADNTGPKFDIIKDAGASYVSWTAHGIMPFNSLMIDFNEDGMMKDMLDTVKEDAVVLKVLTNTASATDYCCITEYIPY